jgi:hypothetical protein
MSNRKHLRSLLMIAVLLVACLAVAGMPCGQPSTVQAQQQRSNAVSTRQVWEYKVLFVNPSWRPDMIESQLNQLAADGWEVATTVMTSTLVYTLKRPK